MILHKQVDLLVPISMVDDVGKAESDGGICHVDNAGGSRAWRGQGLCGHRPPPWVAAELTIAAVSFCLIFLSLLQAINLVRLESMHSEGRMRQK